MNRETLRRDYERWHHLQVSTGDLDPVYPVLQIVDELSGMDREELTWLVFLHVVYYHPGSTFAAFRLAPAIENVPDSAEGLEAAGLLSLPTGTERRGHRDVRNLVKHLLGLREAFLAGDGSGAADWVRSAIGGAGLTPMDRWVSLSDALVGLRGNGRWAAYKTAEMLQKVAGFPIAAPDAGHRYSSGPRKGLALLEENLPTGSRPDDIDTLDLITDLWAVRLGEPDVAQVETSLCDFNSLVGGRYYLGHDIDSMLESFAHPAVASVIPSEAWDARREAFAPELLGEVGGWTGVRKPLKTLYRETGKLL